MASAVTAVDELEATRMALGRRYAERLRVKAAEIADARSRVGEKEAERDDLIRESRTVLRREATASAARLSVGRVDQILGGTT